MTGTIWLEHSGLLWGRVMSSNTHSVGVVRDVVIAWGLAQTGMASEIDSEDWWGVLVQANFGWRAQLTVAGVPVGGEIPELPAYVGSRCTGPFRNTDSIIAVVAAETMVGINDRKVIALPHEKLRAALRKYGRLVMPEN